MKQLEQILISVLFLAILVLGGAAILFLPKKTYSEAERRPLAENPVASIEALLDGAFFDELNDWAADHFPARESFRKLKATWQHDILSEAENNGFVLFDGSIIKLEKQVNTASLTYAGERFQSLFDRYLKDTDCRIYASVIPDKSFFLANAGYPVMDFTEMETLYKESLQNETYISLTELLSLEDYYRTDSHWRQEKLIPVANKLLLAMGGGASLELSDFETAEYAPFTGVYAEQAAFRYQPEEIVYLTGSYLDGVRVLDYETNSVIPLYDPENCDARDPYTLFLGGGKAFLKLENPNAATQKDLVVFRDSFGSSIGPLLAAGYRSVTLIDLRYLMQDVIRRYMRFSNQDVLFLFSATLLNNSQGLR